MFRANNLSWSGQKIAPQYILFLDLSIKHMQIEASEILLLNSLRTTANTIEKNFLSPIGSLQSSWP